MAQRLFALAASRAAAEAVWRQAGVRPACLAAASWSPAQLASPPPQTTSFASQAAFAAVAVRPATLRHTCPGRRNPSLAPCALHLGHPCMLCLTL